MLSQQKKLWPKLPNKHQATTMSERSTELSEWLASIHTLNHSQIIQIAGDASFRSYHRATKDNKSWIIMDAPPTHEGCQQFVDIALSLKDIGLNVPEVLEANLDKGFLLLTDLGDSHYLDQLQKSIHLQDSTAERLYGDALAALSILQTVAHGDNLPDYDKKLLLQEMELFREWFLGKHLGLQLAEGVNELLDSLFNLLADEALSQPVVPVHRDYHSRNLIVTEHNPGILDFQDAVNGPITYDLVSLLKDCYINWQREHIEELVWGFHANALQYGVLSDSEEERFMRWFDFMGVQRHLKAIGIFSRLKYRDGKENYLPDIPRTMNYLVDVSGRYDELSDFHNYLNFITQK